MKELLPYHQLSALLSVVDQGSFGAAARSLHISQSAVSQRIAQLEDELGDQVLLRSNPPTLSELGKELVAHTRRVQALEADLSFQAEESRSLRLGVNADSLSTWFFPALRKIIAENKLLLQLVVDNEDYTFSRMREGEVLLVLPLRRRPCRAANQYCLAR